MRNPDQEPDDPETGSNADAARRSAIAAVLDRLQEIGRMSSHESCEATTRESHVRADADVGPAIQR